MESAVYCSLAADLQKDGYQQKPLQVHFDDSVIMIDKRDGDAVAAADSPCVFVYMSGYVAIEHCGYFGGNVWRQETVHLLGCTLPLMGCNHGYQYLLMTSLEPIDKQRIGVYTRGVPGKRGKRIRLTASCASDTVPETFGEFCALS